MPKPYKTPKSSYPQKQHNTVIKFLLFLGSLPKISRCPQPHWKLETETGNIRTLATLPNAQTAPPSQNQAIRKQHNAAPEFPVLRAWPHLYNGLPIIKRVSISRAKRIRWRSIPSGPVEYSSRDNATSFGTASNGFEGSILLRIAKYS